MACSVEAELKPSSFRPCPAGKAALTHTSLPFHLPFSVNSTAHEHIPETPQLNDSRQLEIAVGTFQHQNLQPDKPPVR